MGSLEFHKYILALVIFPLFLIEITLRIFGSQNENQFGDLFKPLLQIRSESNLLIIGSSRAATAIIPEELKDSLVRTGIINGEVYNLGMGYTRIAEHALALKRITRDNPKALKNSLVLIESIGGIPSHDSWEDPWFHPAFPHFILPFLNREELGRLINSKGVPLESKLFLVPAYYMALPGQILLCRSIIFDRGANFSEYASNRIEPRSTKPDIARAGGIRFDVALGGLSKDSVDQESCNTSSYRRMISFPNIWDHSIVREIGDIVKHQGGQVIIFDVPLTPANQRCVESEMASQARNIFLAKAKEWGFQSILIGKSYSIEDFADEKHIKLTRANEYTALLSAAIEKTGIRSQASNKK